MITKDPYYGVKATSSSSLQFIDPKQGGSPQKYKAFLDGTLDDEEGYRPHLINGTLIHMSVLEPEKFVIADKDKPTATLGEIADAMVIQMLDPVEENILATMEAFNYQANWKSDTKVKKFVDAGGVEYVKYMQEIKNSGKIGMSQSTGTTVESCKTALLADKMCNYVLKEVDEEKGVECLNECEVHWEVKINGHYVKMKAKLDRLIIDHNDKTYSIVDVKTTGKPISLFRDSFYRFRYPRQIRFYMGAAKALIKQRKLKGYTFNKAYITAVETHGYYTATLFDATIPAMAPELGEEIKDLLSQIAYHQSSGDWINSVEKINGGGYLTLEPCKMETVDG